MFGPLIFACTVTHVVDGDTFDCAGGIRVRLGGVDSPELHGCHGRRGRICVQGDGQASKRALERLARGTLTCERVGETYGRVSAWCVTSAGVDLSCAMVRDGYALRWERYDPHNRLGRCR